MPFPASQKQACGASIKFPASFGVDLAANLLVLRLQAAENASRARLAAARLLLHAGCCIRLIGNEGRGVLVVPVELMTRISAGFASSRTRCGPCMADVFLRPRSSPLSRWFIETEGIGVPPTQIMHEYEALDTTAVLSMGDINVRIR